MMGMTQFDLSVPVIKGTNAVTCFTRKQKVEVIACPTASAAAAAWAFVPCT